MQAPRSCRARYAWAAAVPAGTGRWWRWPCSGSTWGERWTIVRQANPLFVGVQRGLLQPEAGDAQRVYFACLVVQALALGEPPVLPDDEMERVIAQMKRMSYGFGPEAEGSNDVARPRGRS